MVKEFTGVTKMYFSKFIFICICFVFIQAAVVKSTGTQEKSTDVLHEFIRLLSDESTGRSSNGQHPSSNIENIEKNPLKPKSLVADSAKGLVPKDQEADSMEGLLPKGLKEDSTEGQPMSPVTWYLLKRMMLDTNKAGMTTKLTSHGAKISRALRADYVIGINSRDKSLPWDKDCSGGYDHCEGYFPLCCEGFVCLKPLTPWDRKHGFNRCWPHYFQDVEDSDVDENG